MQAEIPDWLLKLAETMRTQNNYATAHPIYCVKERDEFYINDQSDFSIPNSDFVKTVYYNRNDDERTFFDSEDEVRKVALENDYDEDDIDIREMAMYEQISTHAFFFTEEAAKAYIDAYPYRLTKPFMYVESAHQSDEVVRVLNFIKSLKNDATAA